MRTHIDWLTFTMAPRYGTFDNEGMSAGDDYAKAIEQAWITTFDAETLANCFGGEWEKQEKSRAPYSDAWAQRERGVTLFAGVSLNHCCVEISGQGCEQLIEKDFMGRILAATEKRITRIDIACDIETIIRPSEFVEQVSHKRMRSHGYQKSASGETYYFGSRTSDRFARVYRYSEPHPRAHLLRVEHVFHKAYAKRVAYEIRVGGLDSVSVASGKAFGWGHPVWQPGEQAPANLSIVGVERNAGATVHWLCTSVAPAFKRLCSEGTIKDPVSFINRYFLSSD